MGEIIEAYHPEIIGCDKENASKSTDKPNQGGNSTAGVTSKKADAQTTAKLVESAPIDPALWRISGADYDLSEFVESHPGGPIAIGLGKGIDCTNLFTLYHAEDSRAHQVLKKYQKGSAKSIPLPHSEFRSDLMQMVKEHFQGKGKSAHKASYFQMAVLATLFAIELYLFFALFTGSWYAVALLPTVCWVVGVNTSHDGSHFAFSDKWWVNHALVFSALPYMYNPFTWYSQHVVEHHCHCNSPEKDVDLFHFFPARLHKDVTAPPNQFLHLAKVVITSLHLGLGIPLNAVTNGLLDGPDGHGFENGTRIKLLDVFRNNAWHYATVHATIILFIGVGLLNFSLHDSWFAACCFSMGPYVIEAMYFIMFTQVSHIQEGCQRDEAINNPDFFKLQAMTSMDYSVESRFWGLCSGGLNVQSLHHCLPWVSSCHYPDIYPKFLKLCKKHGCEPQSAPHLWSALKSGAAYAYSLNTKELIAKLD